MASSWPWVEDDTESEPAGDTPAELDQLLELQQGLLIAVATGGPRIVDRDQEYKDRRRKLNGGLRKLGVAVPFPWKDLWGWYAYWSTNLPTYAERRSYIRELGDPVRDVLERMSDPLLVDDAGTVGGWPSLEGRLSAVKERLVAASTVDDRQDVGRRCREILVDLGQIVYTEEMLGEGEDAPKKSDAKVRLTYAARSLMAGRAHEEWRGLIRAAWDLANKITHSDGIADVDAYACVQVTVLLVRCFERASAEPIG